MKSQSKFICFQWMSVFSPCFYKNKQTKTLTNKQKLASSVFFSVLEQNKLSISFYFHPTHKLLNYINWGKSVFRNMSISEQDMPELLWWCVSGWQQAFWLRRIQTELAVVHKLVSLLHLCYALGLGIWFKNTVTGLGHE